MLTTSADHTTVFLLRHGQTVNTVDGQFRYNGHLDVDITTAALKQMHQRAAELSRFRVSAVYSSDLIRCRRGGEIIAAACNCDLQESPQLREFKMGDWEGLSPTEAESRFPEQVKRKYRDFFNYRIPGSETVAEVASRVYPEFDRIVDTHQGETIVIVAHGGVNLLLLVRALGLPREKIFLLGQDFGCVNQLLLGPDFQKVTMINSAGIHEGHA